MRIARGSHTEGFLKSGHIYKTAIACRSWFVYMISGHSVLQTSLAVCCKFALYIFYHRECHEKPDQHSNPHACSLCILGLAPFSHTHYRCQQYCCPGRKVSAFPALFVNICEKSVIFVHQTTWRLRVMHFIAPTPLHVMIAHTTCALVGVTNIEFSALHVHGTTQC